MPDPVAEAEARIIAWLRNYNHHAACDIWPGGIGHCTCAYDREEWSIRDYLADQIEAGDHRKETGNG